MQIYKITNLINKKFYIGKDTSSDSNYFGSGLLIKRAIEKYGLENFQKEIIDETDNYEELSLKEKYWINHFNSTNLKIGYNISKGGDGGDTLSNHPNLDIIKEKISKNNPKTGKTYEEAFGEEKAKKYKEKLKEKLDLSIFSDKAKENSKLFFDNKREELIKRCEFIREEIKNGKIDNYIEELKLIKKRVPDNFLKNAEGFYNFFGQELKFIFGKNRIKKEKVKKEKKLKEKKVIIDDIEYNSIKECCLITGIKPTTIGFRLISPNFPNYLYSDDALNMKNDKYAIKDDIKKIKICINGIKYNSITEAANELNMCNDSVSMRLKSASYKDWIYLDDRRQTLPEEESRPIKNKKISIDAIIYESIAEAVRQTGIDRQIMRYRLKTKNYDNYFYI
jgi:hypothetical protein